MLDCLLLQTTLEITYTNGDGTTLSTLFCWEGVRFSEVGSPVSTSNWHNAQLCDGDSSTNGGCDFFRGLDAQSDMSFGVTNDNDSLKSSTLTGSGLFLHRFDLSTVSLLSTFSALTNKPS
jgi:hypothetical protein